LLAPRYENIRKHTMCSEIGDTSNGITLNFYVGAQHLAYERLEPAQLDNKQLVFSLPPGSSAEQESKNHGLNLLFTAKFPRAALAARCTSVSWLERRKRMGSSVSRPTGRTSFSVISANASAALRWRSTLSEKESVVSAESGEPAKKLVVVRSFGVDKVTV
jgi:hypothetical protein